YVSSSSSFSLLNEIDNKECDKDINCYSKVFVATNNFQEVKGGQSIPPGLHVKIDFSTGKKYAKILDPNDPNDNDSSDIIIVDPIEPNSNNNNDNIKDDDHANDKKSQSSNSQDFKVTIHQSPSSSPSFSSPPSFDSDNNNNINSNYEFQKLLLLHNKNDRDVPHSDHILFDEYVSQLEKPTSHPLTILISVLDGLEDLVHELDFGIKLTKEFGLKYLISLLNFDSDEVKQKAAMVIGTALQNNPSAQNNAINLNLVPYLLDKFSKENNLKVSSRLLYALSSLVRGNEYAIQFIKNNQGLETLTNVYTKFDDNEFKAKFAVFISDFIDPNMVKSTSTTSLPSFNVAHVDQNQDQDSLTLFSTLMETLCKKFQDTLFDDQGNAKNVDFNSREKILGGISMIKSYYSNMCPAQNGFEIWLSKQQIISNIKDDEGSYDLEDYSRLIKQIKIQYDLK
ncbi:833_t:CDS:2, partial [Entrophospora sp. SA101]